MTNSIITSDNELSMKTHAVPHEIMSVEFKLFGNFLSLREFIYISVGVALAYFFYFLMRQGVIPGILAIPSILVFGLGGTAIGLLPIDDRPLDQWLVNYLTAIKHPTRRVWKKFGYDPTQTTDDGQQIVSKDHIIVPPAQTTTIFANATLKTPKQDTFTTAADMTETSDLSRIESTLQQVETGGKAVSVQATATAATTAPLSPLAQTQAPAFTQTTATPPSSPVTFPSAPLSASIQLSDPVPTQTTTSLQPIPVPIQSSQPVHRFPQPIQQKVEIPLMKHSQISAGSAAVPVNQATQQQTPARTATGAPPQPIPPKKTLYDQKGSSQNEPQKTSVDIDDSNIESFQTTITSLDPKVNTINIVVKDTNGLILPGVVCVIKNSNGDPVRAAISNSLGQIINNVPLKEGTYKINLTKQGYSFPEINRLLNGKAYPPIEIKSL